MENSDSKDTKKNVSSQEIYKNYNTKGMDKNNKKALNIGKTKGEKAMIEHMFKHPKTGRPLSYGEMRMFYG